MQETITIINYIKSVFYVTGGGLGSTRKGGPEVNSKYSGRDDAAKDRSVEMNTLLGFSVHRNCLAVCVRYKYIII